MTSIPSFVMLSTFGVAAACGQSSQSVKGPDRSAESCRQQAARESAAEPGIIEIVSDDPKVAGEIRWRSRAEAMLVQAGSK